MQCKIRLAKEKDLQAINRIYNQAIDTRCSTGEHDHVSMDQRRKWFEEHIPEKYPVIVCEAENIVVGWACLSPYRKGRSGFKYAAEISYYVDNSYKNLGIGSKLLGSIIDKAKELNYRVLLAMLFATNSVSIRLLEKYGFSRWACLFGVIDIDDVVYDHLYYGLKL